MISMPIEFNKKIEEGEVWMIGKFKGELYAVLANVPPLVKEGKVKIVKPFIFKRLVEAMRNTINKVYANKV